MPIRCFCEKHAKWNCPTCRDEENAPSSCTADSIVRCAWIEDSEGCYGTSCGHAWMFTHQLGLEGEQGDGFRFCPFCGNEISTPNAELSGKGSRREDG